MANIHDKAREFLAGEGLKLGNPSKKAIFLFADWLAYQEAAQQSAHRIGSNCPPHIASPDGKYCIDCGMVLIANR